MELHQWTPLCADGSVLGLKYSFGFGTANTMAARLDDGSWMVVSPACRAPDSVLEHLAGQGGVSALVAPNAYHHLGQAAWRKRFPAAVSYAPEGAWARLAKQSPGIAYQGIGALAAKAGDRIALVEPAGQKAPDLVVRVRTADDAHLWFVGDLISNTVASDVAFLPLLVMRLFGGGPGYRFNPLPALVYLKDKVAWKADVRARLAAQPPSVVLPAHGKPVSHDAAAQSAAILA
ncbi:MAG: hypothetical protein FJ100_01930 [Deltaproteobacteria bacterium]|nr:hypothetical protein [Deltaproteobacteria bacterium]